MGGSAIDRLSFGIFMAPFHRVGDNPTLALQRDLELIQWLDYLGYDEAWIGEHHSAGWEIIADPAIFIAAAAERTKQIKLGTGVTSLPYHHPLIVADRMVQLDHMTRGRAMLGVGPGALSSDAYMMGIDPTTQRRRMDESLGAILALLAGDEPVTLKTDWFELREARLQLLPYTRPRFPIAVASQISPAGMVTAGKYGVGALSIGVGAPGGKEGLRKQWAMAEESAAAAGARAPREEWRLVMPFHLAETREQALREVEQGEQSWRVDYFQHTLGRPADTAALEDVIKAGGAIVGTPDDLIERIEEFQQLSGGFGGFLGMAHEWANREATMRSFELLARYVMPRFQGTLPAVRGSQEWVAANRRTIFTPAGAAIVQAFSDAGKELPAEIAEAMQKRGAVRA
ncbi:MAG: LLM class flavin-dependent oxidoreductase [Dehalococcoidia bacterium]